MRPVEDLFGEPIFSARLLNRPAQCAGDTLANAGHRAQILGPRPDDRFHASEVIQQAFRAVRSVFVAENNGYDAAMVSLDLGLAYVKQGSVRELKALAEEMYAVFEGQDIHREALAALLLFQQAAREERLTVERVEGFIRYLRKRSCSSLLSSQTESNLHLEAARSNVPVAIAAIGL